MFTFRSREYEKMEVSKSQLTTSDVRSLFVLGEWCQLLPYQN